LDTKRCSKCRKLYPLPRFGRHPSYCKPCNSVYQRDVVLKDPRRRLWLSSYQNAKARGIEHSIRPKQIKLPPTCKYLGITIDYRRASERRRLRSYDAPSIDRINPARGYTPDNVQVISDLANRMKQNATVEQLLAFAEGVLRAHGDQQV
jgi:hypothetical protein